jgi:phospholipid/cholesterol/gamma-HCH transport system permease protein
VAGQPAPWRLCGSRVAAAVLTPSGPRRLHGIIAGVPQTSSAPPIDPDATAASGPARCHWRAPAEGPAASWTLTLQGDWRAAPDAALTGAPQALASQADARLIVDGQGLTHWDGGLAAALWTQLTPLAQRGVRLDLDRLPAAVHAVLELALQREAGSATAAPQAHATAAPEPGMGSQALVTAQFFGEVLLAFARLLRGRSDMRVVDLWRQLDQTGPLSLGIVALSCFLVGLMLAYMGGAQLEKFGAPAYIADVVTVGMVRELAGLMTGVILSGRLGAAFAAQLGSMQANEEIDALRALGIDPVDYLVMPRLLALLMVAPLVIAYAALVGVLAGLPAATWVYGVPAVEYLHQSINALTWTHIWIGLFKGTLYTALVALAGCREGLHAGRNAQAVGAATTAAVVKALVWIFAAACASTIVFQSLGF